jgi:hypothetical protein
MTPASQGESPETADGEPASPSPKREPANPLAKYDLAEAIASVLRSFFKWGGLVGIFYFLSRMVEDLAGQTTYADVGIDVGILAEVGTSHFLAWGLAVAAVLWALFERRLRRTTIERLTGRNRELEESIDPNRSSSNLTPRGKTRPEDKL